MAVLIGGRTAVHAATPSRTTTARPCPNPDGGRCLERLKAGTYHTQTFQPEITYTVTTGWANFEDLPGNFLLVPPGGSLAGVNPGTSDYIGIYTSIAAGAPGCAAGTTPGVAHTPEAIARWMTHNAGLTTTGTKRASVGGLPGVVLDIQLRKTWKKGCPFSHGVPTVQLITGISPSHLAHGMGPHLTIRLYLLSYQAGTLAVEIDDVHTGHPHLNSYSALIKHIHFAI